MELPSARVIHLTDEYNELWVSESHDVVRRFRETPAYDYLQYMDADTGEFRAYWLGSLVLKFLSDNGIPEAFRNRITKEEHDLYLSSVETDMSEFEQQFTEGNA